MDLIALSIPIFFALIAIEAVVAWRTHRRVYRVQDSVNSLSCGIVQQALSVVLKVATLGAYVLIYEHLAIATLDASSVWVWVLGALGVDLCYYWAHRASHRVGFLWATHVVHHQSEEYNLTTALRQSALQDAVSAPFYFPLAILGLPPGTFVILSTLNTLYQFWIHTRLIDKLGPLEWVLNTPAHHRVHHAIDPIYIDKNYGGVLIVWDRLFGTFQEETVEPNYGTVQPLSSWNPLFANVDTWLKLARLAGRCRRWRDRAYAFFAPPEWRPPALGGPVTIPEVDREARALYAQPTRRGLDLYVAVQLVLVSIALFRLLTTEDMAALELGSLVLFILLSTLAWGGLHEGRSWARALEGARLSAAPALAYVATGWLGLALVGALAIASLAWLTRLARSGSMRGLERASAG